MTRGRAPTVPARQIVTIVMLLACMIGVMVMKSRCGSAVGNLFNAIDTAHDAGSISDGKTTP